MKHSEKLIKKILKFETRTGEKPEKLLVTRLTNRQLVKESHWDSQVVQSLAMKGIKPNRFWGIELEVIK